LLVAWLFGIIVSTSNHLAGVNPATQLFKAPKGGFTVEHVDQFREELIRQEKSTNTISNYIRTIADFAKYIEGRTGKQFDPKEMIELDIREYKSYLLSNAKQNPASINNKLSGLSKFCDYLSAIGVLSSNPAKAVKKVKIQAKDTAPKSLSKNDFYKLRREFHRSVNLRDIAIIETLYNTGCRVSELCNIELDDIQISERKGTLTIRSGKGSKYRTIPLNAPIRKAISDYLGVRPLTNDKRLFLGQRGALRREAVFRILNRYATKANVGEVSPHMLRHTFCRELLTSGVDITTVATLAGHANINTTMVYTQPTEDEKISALGKL